jgi:hypothetical protein
MIFLKKEKKRERKKKREEREMNHLKKQKRFHPVPSEVHIHGIIP